MSYVIGFDLGNFFSQSCFIQGLDPATRRGGRFYDLVNPATNMPYGIPTAFFYSKQRGVLCGEQAVKALPHKNCIRYLKRDLYKDGKPNSVEIDGRTFTYDEMITAAAQYAIRMAVRYLEMQLNIRTNKIALSYPASMSTFVRNHLVELMQTITLENGEKIEIVGTIAEPSAAALDFFACSGITKDATAIVVDIGAGTFDVSVVKLYPQGRKYKNGDTYYYDVKATDGIADLGGKEFDEVIMKIVSKKAGKVAKQPDMAEKIFRSAEPLKRELSFSESTQPEITFSNGEYIPPVTRTEFEKEAEPLVERMLGMVKNTLNANADITIDYMVLTGGASQMPIIERMFKERFPEYKDKICFHMPSKAIASGAARFGVVERVMPTDGNQSKEKIIPSVVLRTIRDLGGDFYESVSDVKGYIETYIKAGTPIPHTTKWIDSYKLAESQRTRFGIYEAKTSSPDEHEVQRDYQLVHYHSHDHGVVRPEKYHTQSRIVIDEKHLAFLEVREPDNPDMGVVRYPFKVDYE